MYRKLHIAIAQTLKSSCVIALGATLAISYAAWPQPTRTGPLEVQNVSAKPVFVSVSPYIGGKNFQIYPANSQRAYREPSQNNVQVASRWCVRINNNEEAYLLEDVAIPRYMRGMMDVDAGTSQLGGWMWYLKLPLDQAPRFTSQLYTMYLDGKEEPQKLQLTASGATGVKGQYDSKGPSDMRFSGTYQLEGDQYTMRWTGRNDRGYTCNGYGKIACLGQLIVGTCEDSRGNKYSYRWVRPY